MKKLILLVLGMASIFCVGCSSKNRNVVEAYDEDTSHCCPPLGYVVELQPLGDFSHQKAEQLREEFVKQLAVVFKTIPKSDIDACVCVKENKTMPASCLYKPRNRYWAGAILKMLHAEHGGNDEIVTIGLTNRDISTSAHGHFNYGVMGLGYHPGDAAVVSTFRLKRKDDLWKVTMHEFLHTRGLPHCKKDNPKCIMQDAHGKDTFCQKNSLCKNCKNALQML